VDWGLTHSATDHLSSHIAVRTPWHGCAQRVTHGSHPTAIDQPHRRAKTSNGWSAVRLPVPIQGSLPSCFSVHKRPYKPERPPSLLFRSHLPLKKNARSAARHNPVYNTV